MATLNAYYVTVDFEPYQDSYLTGIRNRLNIVIAESEEDAVTIMKSHTLNKEQKNLFNETTELPKMISATVSIPKFGEDTVKADSVGHGTEISEFLNDPSCRQSYRELLNDYFLKHNDIGSYSALEVFQESVNNMNDIQIWDQSGEVQILNKYLHGTYMEAEEDAEAETESLPEEGPGEDNVEETTPEPIDSQEDSDPELTPDSQEDNLEDETNVEEETTNDN